MRHKQKRTKRRTYHVLKRRLRKVVVAVLLVVLAGPPLGIVFFRVVPPLLTPLMVIRLFEGGLQIRARWSVRPRGGMAGRSFSPLLFSAQGAPP